MLLILVPNVSSTVAGTSDEARSFGSLDYWLRLRIPATETARLYDERVRAAGYVHSALGQVEQVLLRLTSAALIRPSVISSRPASPSSPLPPQQLSPPSSSSFNQLCVVVQSCRGLRARGPRPPSPYVVYKLCDFPDHPTATVQHRSEPDFQDRRCYSVAMDAELDRYLRAEALRFYVFDQDEEQDDEYMGKAAVPLLALAQGHAVTGQPDAESPLVEWGFVFPGSPVTVTTTA